MTMRATSVMRSVRAFIALLVVGATGASSVVAAKPVKPSRPRAMNLFSSAGYLFEVNRQQCGLLNTGVVCAAFAGSPVGGGGFWPKGTPDQYIFWSGLQMAGIVSRTSGFAWAGDTSGAYFVDFRGDQQAGNPLSLIFSRLVPQDVAAWSATPPTKTVLDTSIYNPVLIGSDAISQGDVFVRYWEGDPVALTGREHPMGIAVDQRVLAWNFPSGNEDIIYIIYTFYNITARSSSGKYVNSTIPGPLQAEIAAIGDQFQDINENKFKIQIPDGGYTIDSLYAAAAMDADVAVFSQNYATAIVPFNLGLEYTGTFLGDVGWQFPPDIFGPPFAAATGFIGMKFLKSPKDATGKQVGLTMFSQEINGSTGLPDAVGVRQLYRYLSGSVGPTDNPCNPSAPGPVVRARRYCFLGQFQADARFFQASGPFSLPPGEARTIVVAYINAAPYNGTGTPLVNQGKTADTKPGTGGVGLTALPGDSIRLIDKIAGWVSSTDANGDGKISQDEVTTVPRSLLAKALVAQTVFDKGFLLPSAPEAPDFYVVPGDNQVTVVWSKSRTETIGDPFFAIASNAASALYDPTFRHFDAEGDRSILTLRADTAVISTQCADVKCPPLGDTGVPFAYVDANVRNSFTYFYSVTAFDLNALKSGPTSLESPRITKRVTPRKAAANLQYATLISGVFGDDTTTLNPTRTWTISATTGRFTGPPPPTGADALAATFAPLVPQLLPALSLTMTVDSVLPRFDVDCTAGTNAQGICYEFFVTYTAGTTKSSFRTVVFWPIWTGFSEPASSSAGLGGFPVTADSASATRVGVPNGFSKFNASVNATLTEYIQFSAQENAGGRRLLGSVSPGGSRWFTGADETVDHPTYSIRVGHIPGVDSIWAPISHVDNVPTTT